MTDNVAGNSAPTRPGTTFWVVGIVALLWNLVGLYSFWTSLSATPEQLAGLYSPEQVALIEGTPGWAEALTGIAVLAGVIGSILLLMRNRLAVPVFAASLVALILQDIYIFAMTDSLALFGAQPLILQGTVLLIAIVLVWYARRQKAIGVLR